jgi:hypothetical protein
MAAYATVCRPRHNFALSAYSVMDCIGRRLGLCRGVNAGEKMHRRAGVKMHHGRRHSAATLNSAFQFDQ